MMLMGVPKPPVYPEPSILSMSSRGEIFMRWNVDMESIIDLGSLTKRGLSKAALDIKIVPGSSET
jgi:hypothetical protein